MKKSLDKNIDSKRDSNFAKKSSLYNEFLAEKNEILKHKWLESEKSGHDIGFDRALRDWILNHRNDWRISRYTD